MNKAQTQHWFEISIQNFAAADQEKIEELAASFLGTTAVIEEEVHPHDALEAFAQDLQANPPKSQLKFYIQANGKEAETKAAELTKHLQNAPSQILIQLKDCGPGDWDQLWKSQNPAITIADTFYITTPWDPNKPAAHLHQLVINPSMGFGNGDHPTTHGCLELLSQIDLQGRTVFDIGTGSGILALAARARGALRVEACDIQQEAIDDARINQTLTQAAEEDADKSADESALDRAMITFKLGHFNSIEGRADVIIANIVAEVLIPLIPQIATRLNPEGQILLGGIRAKHEAKIKEALKGQILQVLQCVSRDDFLSLLTKPSPATL